MDTMSRRSKSEDQKIEELIYKPEHGFVNVLRFGILALQLLPENATAGEFSFFFLSFFFFLTAFFILVFLYFFIYFFLFFFFVSQSAGAVE